MNRQLQANFLKTISGKLIGYLAIFAQGIIISRLLGPEFKGYHSKLQASFFVLTVLLEFGLSRALLHSVSSGRISLEQARTKSLRLLVLNFFISNLLIFACAMLSPSLLFPNLQVSVWFFVYLSFGSTFEIFRQQSAALASTQNQFTFLSGNEVSFAFLRLTLFVLVSRLSLPLVASLQLLIALDLGLSILNSLWINRFLAKLPTSTLAIATPDRARRFMSLIYFSNLIVALQGRLDIWMVESFASASSFGAYAVAVTLAQTLTLIPLSVTTASLPGFSHVDQIESRSHFALSSRICFSGLAVAALLLSLLADHVVPLLLGSSWTETSQYLKPLCIVVLLSSIKFLMGTYLQSRQAHRLKIAADALGVISLVTGALWLGPLYGIQGVIASSACSNLLSLLILAIGAKDLLPPVQTLFFVRRKDFGLSDLLPFKSF